MKHEVLAICTAYEQGYGHGYDQRNLGNPYKANSDEWQAWGYGYSEGNRKKLAQKLDRLDSGPWPSFVTGLKRLNDDCSN